MGLTTVGCDALQACWGRSRERVAQGFSLDPSQFIENKMLFYVDEVTSNANVSICIMCIYLYCLKNIELGSMLPV